MNDANNNIDSPTSPQPGEVIKSDNELAANLIRTRIDKVYKQTEPDARVEEAEVLTTKKRSKHQQFMYELTTSNKSLVEVQTEWHKYYIALSDEDKKQVWQEFYESNKTISQMPVPTAPQAVSDHIKERAIHNPKNRLKSNLSHSQALKEKRKLKPKITWQQQIQSLIFGLSMGAIVVFIVLFGFFNQVFIAPFIQPSRNITATPIILSTNTITPSNTPEVIIPKINVEIPINYNVKTTNESTIEDDLEGGVVHYPTTVDPGQIGNAAFFGHSANNIFNPGKYKFAFVLLHELVPGDVFYLTYNHVVYAYKVFYTTVVNPSDVSVLGPVAGHKATATLITCNPPGTSLDRLIVVGNQISPNPNNNVTATPAVTTTNDVTHLPGNGPSFWSRFISTIYGKVISLVFIIAAVIIIGRWIKKMIKTSRTN